MQERTVPLPVTIGLLLAVIIGVGVLMKSKEYTQLVPNFPAAVEAATTAQSTFSAVDAAAWHYTELAERDIQEFGEGQRIMDGIIVDPADGAIAYFASSSFNTKEQEMTLSIYRYDMQNLSFTRLYQSVYSEGQSRYLGKHTWPLWHVIGYDRKQLVILLQDVNDAIAECHVPLLVGINSSSAYLMTLSIADPSTGLSLYTPKDDDIAEARGAYSACLTR